MLSGRPLPGSEKGRKYGMFTANRKTIKYALLFLCCALLLGGCGKAEEPNESATLSFANGEIEKTAESVVLQLAEGETALLEELTELRSADLRGSECEDEILTYAAAHPGVDVLFTVTMSDGTKADTDAEKLTAVLSADDMPRLEALKNLRSADLRGSSCEKELAAFAEEHPDAELLFTVTLPDGTKVDTDVEELDLSTYTSDMTEAGVEALKALRGLKKVELGVERSDFTRDDVLCYMTTNPDAEFRYEFKFKGHTINTGAEQVDLRGVWMKNDVEDIWEILPLLRRCTWLDLDGTGVSTDECVAMMEQNPGLRIIWRVMVGDGDAVRTDTKKIWFNTLKNTDLAQNLKYCIDCELLDLGHCKLKDVSFLASMPNLRVCILGLNPLTDISALKSLKKLEYLEIFNMPLADLSPLADHPDLAHLNIVLTEVTDLTPLYNCPLQRLWIGDTTPVSEEEVEAFRKVNPDCEINTTTYSPSDGGWRRYEGNDFAPRYLQLRDEMGY